MQKFEFKGGIYEGEALNGVPHGKGRLTVGDSFYDGDFVDGKHHGRGETLVEGLFRADGIWSEHRFVEGRVTYMGEYLYLLGCEPETVYEGKFENFFLVGKGKIIKPNGEIFEGEFLEGKPHGEGKLTLCDGTVVKGTWNNGVKRYEYTDEDYKNSGGDERFCKKA
jgi:hypothetical protein